MASNVNLWIDQGSDYFTAIDVAGVNGTAFDLTGYTAYASVRKSYTSLTSTPFTVAIPQPTSGAINLSLTNSQTASLEPGWYVYDVTIVSNSGSITRVLEGQIEVTAMATFPPGWAPPVPIIPPQSPAATDVGAGGGIQVGSALTASAPAALLSINEQSTVTLMWTPDPNAVTYNIYRSTTSGGEGTSPFATGVSATTTFESATEPGVNVSVIMGSWIDTAVVPGTTYYYTVTSVNSFGESAQSMETSASPTG